MGIDFQSVQVPSTRLTSERRSGACNVINDAPARPPPSRDVSVRLSDEAGSLTGTAPEHRDVERVISETVVLEFHHFCSVFRFAALFGVKKENRKSMMWTWMAALPDRRAMPE